jgi:general secretion pathway protein E
VADTATEADQAMLGQALPVGTHLYRPRGCSECFQEGYRGRTGLYEVVVVDETLQRLIHGGASEIELLQAARAAGPSLAEDGIAKLKEGLTSVEEVARVLGDEV